MRSRNWTVVAVLGAVAAAVIGGLSTQLTEAQQVPPSRQMTLSPPDGVPPEFEIARGSATIAPLDQQFNRFLTYEVQQLRTQPGSLAFGLYMSTTSIPRTRIRTFNTSGGEANTKHWRGFAGVPDPENSAWETETVTLEIYLEDDDGFDAPDIGGILVLRGESPGN